MHSVSQNRPKEKYFKINKTRKFFFMCSDFILLYCGLNTILQVEGLKTRRKLHDKFLFLFRFEFDFISFIEISIKSTLITSYCRCCYTYLYPKNIHFSHSFLIEFLIMYFTEIKNIYSQFCDNMCGCFFKKVSITHI